MFTCLVLYRGTKLSDLELISLTTNRQFVGEVANRLLARDGGSADRAISARQKGIRAALRMIAREASHD